MSKSSIVKHRCKQNKQNADSGEMILKADKEESSEINQIKSKRKVTNKEIIPDNASKYIKEEPLDIKPDKIIAPCEVVQNNKGIFLVPILQTKLPPNQKTIPIDQSKDMKTEKLIDKETNKTNKDTIENDKNVKPAVKKQHRKIYRPPTEEELEEEMELKKKCCNGLRKTEQICTETVHEVDIFTIFGKSVGDQLRSFPIARAISLQNKIQDLITEERLNTFLYNKE